ncbi:hypothetical protein HDU97_009506 [Phlyctochytrium planicorne]|nr:hypothetical protein HDU97_009506 [Phlyctochytrium planicorne]
MLVSRLDLKQPYRSTPTQVSRVDKLMESVSYHLGEVGQAMVERDTGIMTLVDCVRESVLSSKLMSEVKVESSLPAMSIANLL